MPPEIRQVQVLLFGLRAAYGCPGAGMSCVNGVCRSHGNLHVQTMRPTEVLAPTTLCVSGLAKGAVVQFVITTPNGVRHPLRRRCTEGGTLRAEILLPRGSPGRYRIQAHTGRRHHERTLQVVAATRRRIQTVPTHPRVGDTLHIGLVRYLPNRAFALHVYLLVGELKARKGKQTRTRFRYHTTVHLRTDAHGLAVAPLRTSPTAPPGYYVVATRPGVWLGGLRIDPAIKK